MIISIVFRIYSANIIVVKNSELKTLNTRKSDLEREVSRLSYVDSTYSTLSDIEKKARSLGFTDYSESLLSLNPNSPIPVAAISDR